MDNRPIGMFDSGVGGLTVYKEIRKKFPNENIVYLGDTKSFPYGSKSKESIINLTKSGIGCCYCLWYGHESGFRCCKGII